MTAALLTVVALPLFLGLLLVPRTRLREACLPLAPWSAAPALLLAFRPAPIEPASISWLLLGTRVGLDATGQVFLFLSALLWTVAGVYARAYLRDDPERYRFFVFFLLTMSGNLGLVVAQDVVTFYAAFALMTFAAYPLVVHRGDAAALRAGRVYVVMAVLGEAMLLAGFLLAARGAAGLGIEAIEASVADSPSRGVIIGLLLAGFGVKAGALPLHMWLPLAHPVAPTPASAVLSGAMIKAGLLGWLRFLPLGHADLPGWGALLVALALGAAFFGVAIGLLQDDAKTALAYSSISQMGLINVGVGIALANPAARGSALAACLVYAAHHGLAKGALFLGVGVAEAAGDAARRRLALAGLGFAALAVAGAPFTSGMVAKRYLKEVAPLSPAAWPQLLDILLPLAAVGTTLLMARFLWIVARGGHRAGSGSEDRALWPPWAALLLAVVGTSWLLPRRFSLSVAPPGWPDRPTLWIAAWPVAAGLLLAVAVLLLGRAGFLPRRLPQIAAGDVLGPLERLVARLRRALPETAAPANPVASLASRWYGVYAHGDEPAALLDAEARLNLWSVAAGLVLVLVAVLFAALMLG